VSGEHGGDGAGRFAIGVMVLVAAAIAVVLLWGLVDADETTNIPTTEEDTPLCEDPEALKYLRVQDECHRIEADG
jgi:hypothetical protein